MAQRALYHNLGKNEEMAHRIDAAVMASRLADWPGYMPKENKIKQAIYEILKDKSEVERIFQIIKQQNEYK